MHPPPVTSMSIAACSMGELSLNESEVVVIRRYRLEQFVKTERYKGMSS